MWQILCNQFEEKEVAVFAPSIIYIIYILGRGRAVFSYNYDRGSGRSRSKFKNSITIAVHFLITFRGIGLGYCSG